MSVETARRTSLELMYVLENLGTATQGGMIPRAYGVARNALRQNLALPTEAEQRRAAKETLTHLRDAVRAAAQEALQAAWDLGVAQAQSDGAELGLEIAEPKDRSAKIKSATALVEQETKTQTDALWLLILLGFALNARLIFGPYYLNPAPALKTAKFWGGALLNQTYDRALTSKAKELEFRVGRMAVLGSNAHHTQTCLNVNGQVVGLDEDFVLTGTPRYAERMRNPPFHNYCYTTVTLVKID